MFGIGLMELCVIAVVALVFVGPKKLPELMRQAGKLFVYLRRMSNEVRYSVQTAVYEAEDEIRRSETPKPEEKPKDAIAQNSDKDST